MKVSDLIPIILVDMIKELVYYFYFLLWWEVEWQLLNHGQLLKKNKSSLYPFKKHYMVFIFLSVCVTFYLRERIKREKLISWKISQF